MGYIPLWVWAASTIPIFPMFRYAILPYYTRVKECNKTIIITGATGRLGRTLSYELAKRNCRLILACRNLQECKYYRRELVLKTNNRSIACRYLDLEDIESVDKFVERIIEEEPRLDVLINNAGIKSTPKKEFTKYGIEKMFFVNFLAPFYLTIRLRDKLLASARQTGESRIVNNVGTIRNSWVVNYEDLNFDRTEWSSKLAYRQSKMALAYMTILMEKLHKEKCQDLYVFATSPCGSTHIDSMNNNESLLQTLTMLASAWFMFNSASSTQSMILCAIDPEFAQRDKSGRFYSYWLSSWGWPKKCQNELDAKLVWNKAIDLLNTKPEWRRRAVFEVVEILRQSTMSIKNRQLSHIQRRRKQQTQKE